MNGNTQDNKSEWKWTNKKQLKPFSRFYFAIIASTLITSHQNWWFNTNGIHALAWDNRDGTWNEIAERNRCSLTLCTVHRTPYMLHGTLDKQKTARNFTSCRLQKFEKTTIVVQERIFRIFFSPKPKIHHSLLRCSFSIRYFVNLCNAADLKFFIMFSVPNSSIRCAHIRSTNIDWVISINPKFRNDTRIFQTESNSTYPSANKRKISYAFATQKDQTVWTFRNATRPNVKKKKNKQTITSSAGSLYFLRSKLYSFCLVLNVTFSGTPRVLCQFPYKINFTQRVYVCVSVSFVLHFGFVIFWCKIVWNLFPGLFLNPVSFPVCAHMCLSHVIIIDFVSIMRNLNVAKVRFVTLHGHIYLLKYTMMKSKRKILTTKSNAFLINFCSSFCLQWFFFFHLRFECKWTRIWSKKKKKKRNCMNCVCFSFLFIFSSTFTTEMLYGRRKLRRRANKSRINSTTLVHSDDIILFDLMEQLIGVCCCSVLTYAYVDSSNIIQTQTTTTKSQAIQRNERQSKKFHRKYSIFSD